MSEVVHFRPSLFVRIWNVVAGAFLCWTCALVPVGIYLFGVALFRQVVISPTAIAVKPFGGTIQAAEIKRWGRYVYRRAADKNRRTMERTEWLYVVIETQSGKQVSFCADDFADRAQLLSLLQQHFGDSSSEGVAWRWLAAGPRYAA